MNTSTHTPTSQQLSWFDQNRRKLVGIGYLIGDAAIAANGLLEARATTNPQDKKSAYGEVVTGLGWAVGGAAMGFYGNRPLEKQMEALEQRLSAHFAEQSITLSEDVLLKAKKENDKSFFAKFEDFCYKYPTEILNATYGLLAIPMIMSGYNKQYKGLMAHQDTFSLKDITKVPTLGMGVTILAGALAGLLIKHKSKEQIEEEGIGAFRGAFHQNASKINGGIYLANNGFTILGAVKNKNDYKDSTDSLTKNMYLLRVITAGSYIGSNILLAGGSEADKQEAALAEDAKTEILRGCAQIINAQDPQLRDALIDETAKYLCNQKELGFSLHAPKRLATKLKAEFNQLLEKPASWTGRVAATAADEQVIR